jgi:hypothetical protein
MEFSIFLENGITKKYTINDIALMEEYPGNNNKWDEIAIIFKDNSILWEGSGCITYAIDGKEFITNNRINTSGLWSSSDKIQSINVKNYNKFVKSAKEKGHLDRWAFETGILSKKMTTAYTILAISKMNDSSATKIQTWYRQLPGCRKCGSKRLAWKYICVYCYHDRHINDCLSCVNEDKHCF